MSSKSEGTPLEDVWVWLLIFITLAVLYHFSQPYIEELWRWRRIFELKMLSWMPDSLPFIGELKIRKALLILYNMKASDIPDNIKAAIDIHHGMLWSWIPAAYIFWLARNTQLPIVYNRTHNQESILRVFSSKFGFLRNVVDPTLVSESQTLPKELHGRVSDDVLINPRLISDPLVFAAMNPPYGLTQSQCKSSILSPSGFFSDEVARQCFDNLLGNPFTGIESFSATEKAAYDWLYPKINVDDELQKTLLKAKAKGAKIEDPARIADLASGLRKRKVEEICSKHGFCRTVIIALFSHAKETGVVKEVDVLDLQHKDIVLWDVLSGVGREVASVFSAAAAAHYALEVATDMAIRTPETTEAIEALRTAAQARISH